MPNTSSVINDNESKVHRITPYEKSHSPVLDINGISSNREWCSTHTKEKKYKFSLLVLSLPFAVPFFIMDLRFQLGETPNVSYSLILISLSPVHAAIVTYIFVHAELYPAPHNARELPWQTLQPEQSVVSMSHCCCLSRWGKGIRYVQAAPASVVFGSCLLVLQTLRLLYAHYHTTGKVESNIFRDPEDTWFLLFY